MGSVNHERNHPVVRRIMLEITPFFVGALLDILTYHELFVNGQAWHTAGIYISIGLLLTLIVVIYEVRKVTENTNGESLKSQFFEEMAYKDALTGLNNRAAFDREIYEIVHQKEPYQKILCVSADLNGLKRVNDTLGH